MEIDEMCITKWTKAVWCWVYLPGGIVDSVARCDLRHAVSSLRTLPRFELLFTSLGSTAMLGEQGWGVKAT